MMILMASQSCAAGKCLLAVGVRAFIRALAGMDSSVSCQRA
jgi:hypothetical protein